MSPPRDCILGDPECIKFGFPELEDAIQLSRDVGRLVVLASCSEMGKSDLALDIATGFAREEIKPVTFYSLRLQAKEVSLKLLNHRAKIDDKSPKASKLLDTDLGKVAKCVSDLSELPIFISGVDDGGLDLDKLRKNSLEVKEQNGLGLIVIDYLELLGSAKGSYSRKNMSEVMSDLRLLAKEFKIPVIALSELNGAVGPENDRIPRLSHLDDSIQSEADIVMFLSADDPFNSDCTYPDGAEIVIAKNGYHDPKRIKL